MKGRWWTKAKAAGLVGALAVAFVAIFLATPHPEVDWDGTIIPMAQAYRGEASDDPQKPLQGTVVVVTGATSGIGLDLARAMYRLGASVVAMGRSPSKLKRLEHEMPAIRTIQADFIDLQEVQRGAQQIAETVDRVDILINNAGVHDGMNNLWGKAATKQGYDRVFGVNYLSHVLLTELLAPLLSRSPKPTVLQLSSSFHWAVDGSDLVPVQGEDPIAARVGGNNGSIVTQRSVRSYSNSKLAQILHARALRKHHPLLGQEKARIVNACPGWVHTNLGGAPGSSMYWLMKTFGWESHGWGIVSALHAIFDQGTDPDKHDYYVNTSLINMRRTGVPLVSYVSYLYGLRDILVFHLSLWVAALQKFVPQVGPVLSSPESYNHEIVDGLYQWSYQAIQAYRSHVDG